MKFSARIIAAVGVVALSIPGLAPAQSLTHYVKYETAGRIAWGLLEGDTIRELQGNVFDGAKPSGRTLKLSDVKLLAPADAKKVIAAGLNYRSHIGEQSPQNTSACSPSCRPRWSATTPTSSIRPTRRPCTTSRRCAW